MPEKERIVLGHGSGGALSAELLREVIFPYFRDVQPADGAVLDVPAGARPVFTTDTFVVKPLFFSGGNIGSIAVNGTLNDLAMMGAEPAYLSCGLVLEEGFPLADLAEILRSMREAAAAVGARLVTGDTKVVGRGEADGIFINTSGVGFIHKDLALSPGRVRPGDLILINGGLGEHGVAVLAGRLGVNFQPELQTDSAPLWPAVAALLAAGIEPRVMRDITRGGLAGIACELADGTSCDFVLREDLIPIDARVAKACEIWGFDPLHVACEGRFLAVVAAGEAERAVERLKASGFVAAAAIGRVEAGRGDVVLQTAAGGTRMIKPLPAELLPRIC